jgi:hypothetical protein
MIGGVMAASSIPSVFALLIFGACLFGLGGCAVVRTSGGAGGTRIVHIAALGVADTPAGFSIGYQDAQIVLPADACRAVFVIRSDAEAAAAARLAQAAERGCVVDAKSD